MVATPRARPPSRCPGRRRCRATRRRAARRARAIAWSSVVRTRAPLAPIGWPSAIAPPLTLIFFGSSAELAQHAERLRRERLVQLEEVDVLDASSPAFSSAFAHAGHGPMPMMRARRRPRRSATMRASGVEPSSLRLRARHDHHRRRAVVDARRVARRDRAALFLNAGEPASARPSCRRAGARRVSNVIVVALLRGTSTGTISFLNLPASIAARPAAGCSRRELVLLLAGDLVLARRCSRR